MTHRLLIPLTIASALAAASCFNPDLPDLAFFCTQSSQCPDGYTCQTGPGGIERRCVKDGTTWASDKKDAGADKKVAPKDGPAKDGPAKDKSQGGPTVTLISPNDKTNVHNKNVKFIFKVTNNKDAKVDCTIHLTPKPTTPPTGQVPVVKGNNNSIMHTGMALGSYSWTASCKNISGGPESARPKALKFEITPKTLTGCSSTPLVARTYYKLTSATGTMTASMNDCFVVSGDGTELDGNNIVLKSKRLSELYYNRCGSSCEEASRMIKDPATTTLTTTDEIISPGGIKINVGESVAVGDFNNDGYLDLVNNYLSTPGLSVMYSSSNGTVGTSLYATSFSGPRRGHRVADFDQDGVQDIFSAGYSVVEQLLRGTGKPPVKAQDTTVFSAKDADGGWAGSLGSDSRRVELGDFNGDHVIDVAVSNSKGAAARVSLITPRTKGIGVEAMATKGHSWSSDSVKAYSDGDILAGDIDGDNKWDLVLPDIDQTTGKDERCHPVKAKWASKNLTFTRFDWGSVKNAPITNCQLTDLADLDGDGYPDLVSLAQSSTGSPDTVRIYRYSHSAKKFLAGKDVASTKPPGMVHVIVRDLNRDDLPDLITLPAHSSAVTPKGPVTIYRNTSTAGALSFVKAEDLPTNTQVRSGAARDLDNDGYMDLVFAFDPDANTVKMKRYMLTWSSSGVLTVKAADLRKKSGSVAFNPVAVGAMLDPFARAVVVTGKGAVVKNFGAIRGFSVGVDVNGLATAGAAEGFKIDNVGVENPDIAAYRVRGVSSGSLKDIEVRYLHQGRGLLIEQASGIELNTVTLCPTPGHDSRLNSVSMACVKRPSGPKVIKSSSKNIKVKLNNGCDLTGLSYSICP